VANHKAGLIGHHRSGIVAHWLIAMASAQLGALGSKAPAVTRATADALVVKLGGPGSAACRGWAWLLTRSVSMLVASTPSSLSGQDKRKANNALKLLRADAAAAAESVQLSQERGSAAETSSLALARSLSGGIALASHADAFAADMLSEGATVLGAPASSIFAE
jgi:hypothetical protein